MNQAAVSSNLTSPSTLLFEVDMTRDTLIRQIMEASIGHMTSARYRDVLKLVRLHAKSRYKVSPNPTMGDVFGGKYIGGMRTRGKEHSEYRDISVVVDPDMESEGQHAYLSTFLKGKSNRTKREVAKGRVIFLPTPRVDKTPRELIKGVIAHELLHAHDPSDRSRKGTRPGYQAPIPAEVDYQDKKSVAQYFASPRERHVYSAVAGTLGVRDLQKSGANVRQARAFLRRGGAVTKKAATSYKQLRDARKATKRGPRATMAWRRAWANIASPALEYRGLLGSKKKKHRKAGQKFFKEIHKGMERRYGKAYTPKRKLPEEVRDWLNDLK